MQMWERVLSAVVTMLIIVLLIRLFINRLKNKRPDIQEPDWLKKRNRGDDT